MKSVFLCVNNNPHLHLIKHKRRRLPGFISLLSPKNDALIHQNKEMINTPIHTHTMGEL